MDESSARRIGDETGFDLQAYYEIPEIDGQAHVYSHTASGARLLLLSNDDPDKSFSISFKTPAEDDTGVFHILEHSVLCGSDRYPVKEPFVTLLKTSMQTFLNAMTFPDKTMYPVSSTNDRDLMNLMDVYLDAVFHPRIHHDPLIFQQEGWHIEFDPERDGGLVYNGVVYNEMKGALSDPEQVLYDTLSEALFPDTTYRFESGGDPASIPDLTYEAFLDTHSRRYSPENSYIVLYGDVDAKALMAHIDEGYLTPISMNRTRAELPVIEMQEPVIEMGVQREMATAPENSCAAFGYVIGRASDRVRIAAASLLVDAIMGSNEAPLKRALLDAGIADECDTYVSDSMLQPFSMITAKGLRGSDAVARMGSVIEETIGRLSGRLGADGKLDEGLIEAALAHAEFTMREFDFGYSDGVMLAMSAMGGWLYDDDPEAAVSNIRYEDLFSELRGRLGTGYYHDLLAELFLDNAHHAQAEIVPVDSVPEPASVERLTVLEGEMDDAKRDAITADVDALRAAQAAVDDPENLAKLPHLTREDIGKAPDEPAVEVSSSDGATILRHSVDTHGISYMSHYLDADHVTADELPYLSILAVLLGKLDTASHTAAELDTLVQAKMGSLAFSCDVFVGDASNADGEPEGSPEGKPAGVPMIKLVASGSSLEKDTEEATGLICEILTETDFSDEGRILDILKQRKVGMEQRFANSGNSVAASRAQASIDVASSIGERIDGISSYLALKRMIEDLENGTSDLQDTLRELKDRLVSIDGAVVSFAGTDAAYDDWSKALSLPSGHSDHPILAMPQPVRDDSAYAVPSDVTYSAMAFDASPGGVPLEETFGLWQVASRILTFDYLWNRVRVVGGAYGVGFNMSRRGIGTFHSFRDPHVSETFDSFSQTDGWMESFDPSEDEFEGYVVSTAASLDRPLKPRALVRRQTTMHLTGYSRDSFLRHRQQVVDATIEEVRDLGPGIGALCREAATCVVGSGSIIGSAGRPCDTIELMEA